MPVRPAHNGNADVNKLLPDDNGDHWISEHPEIARIADAIGRRRIELGKTSGFERTRVIVDGQTDAFL